MREIIAQRKKLLLYNYCTFESHGLNSETRGVLPSTYINTSNSIQVIFKNRCSMCSPRSKRPCATRSDENREELDRRVEENPSVSTRRKSQNFFEIFLI